MSLIDLLFVQNEDLVTGFGTIPKIADHEGIVLSLNIKREKLKTKTKTVYDYKNADIDGLVKHIKEFDFNTSVFSKNVYL